MATEFVFYGSQDLTTEALLDFIAAAVGGSVVGGDYVRREGLFVTPRRETPGEEGPTEQFFGFRNRITITFRLANLASREVEDRNIVTVISATLLLLDTYAGAGVLLFNDAYVVLQRINGGVVVNSEWEELAELPELRELVKTRELRPLPQPLLEPQTGES